MNKLLLTLTFFICAFTAFAQVTFEPGYFIDNEGRRVDCLIKNEDRVANPARFEYKLTQDADVKTAALADVQEFEILNTVHKYKRYTVNIDRASPNLKELNFSREPELKQESLFLRVLVAGKASLFSYKGNGGIHYFYIKHEDEHTELLVYKKYLADQNSIQENNAYRQQLWMMLQCAIFPSNYFDKLPYNENSLVKTLSKYNECVGAEFTDYTKKQPKRDINFVLKAGASSFYADLEQYLVLRSKPPIPSFYFSYPYFNTLEQKFSPQIGLEVESVLPFYRGRWSLYAEPTIQYHHHTYDVLAYRSPTSSTDPDAEGNQKTTMEVNFLRVSIPLGVKYTTHLNEASKVFAKTGIAFNTIFAPSKSIGRQGVDVVQTINEKKVSTNLNAFVGLGFMYNSKYSIELQYHAYSHTSFVPRSPKRGVEPVIVKSTYVFPMSFMLGYKLPY